MTETKFPKPEDIQREFEEFVRKRFGDHVQVISQEVPMHGLAKNKGASSNVRKDRNFELRFEQKPRQIKEHLDRFIIGQDEAKKALAIAVCDHYNHVMHRHKYGDDNLHENYSKQNVLLLGPTGVGKTYMVKQISKLIGVPFVKADATRFSETGYVGANVEDLIKDLVHQADGNIEKAQYGIVYLDEADKLATPSSHGGRDVSGRGVQLGLLKLMEETEIDLRAGHDPASQMQAFMEMQQKGRIDKQIVNTRHILFIVSGAFTGIDKLISKRLSKKRIGFGAAEKHTQEPTAIMQQAVTQDFIDYGFEPEFIGRLPIRVACHDLCEDQLLAILKNSEGSITRQYEFSFNSFGIKATFSDGALRAIATTAAQEKTGARALMTVLERTLRDFKYELPSTNILELEISEATIVHPREELDKLLQMSHQEQHHEIQLIRSFEKDFARLHDMKITFNREAVRIICEQARESHVSADTVCTQLLQSYEHGLKLIQQNTGQSKFDLTEDVVRFPKQTLEKMVKDSYNRG